MGITVDGTDATSNPERPSVGMFGDFNYINAITPEAVQEVQIPKAWSQRSTRTY